MWPPIKGTLEALFRQLLADHLAGLPTAQSHAAVRWWETSFARSNILISVCPSSAHNRRLARSGFSRLGFHPMPADRNSGPA
jgi:hypothetical protein